jgi:hypothetical protein
VPSVIARRAGPATGTGANVAASAPSTIASVEPGTASRPTGTAARQVWWRSRTATGVLASQAAVPAARAERTGAARAGPYGGAGAAGPRRRAGVRRAGRPAAAATTVGSPVFGGARIEDEVGGGDHGERAPAARAPQAREERERSRPRCGSRAASRRRTGRTRARTAAAGPPRRQVRGPAQRHVQRGDEQGDVAPEMARMCAAPAALKRRRSAARGRLDRRAPASGAGRRRPGRRPRRRRLRHGRGRRRGSRGAVVAAEDVHAFGRGHAQAGPDAAACGGRAAVVRAGVGGAWKRLETSDDAHAVAGAHVGRRQAARREDRDEKGEASGQERARSPATRPTAGSASTSSSSPAPASSAAGRVPSVRSAPADVAAPSGAVGSGKSSNVRPPAAGGSMGPTRPTTSTRGGGPWNRGRRASAAAGPAWARTATTRPRKAAHAAVRSAGTRPIRRRTQTTHAAARRRGAPPPMPPGGPVPARAARARA